MSRDRTILRRRKKLRRRRKLRTRLTAMKMHIFVDTRFLNQKTDSKLTVFFFRIIGTRF